MTSEHKNDKDNEILAHKDRRWNEQQLIKSKLLRQGAERFFSVSEMPEISGAFLPKKDVATCIDEGTAHMAETSIDSDYPNLVAEYYIAGSGILYPAENWDKRLTRVAELLLSKGVKMVTSHEGCGAAKIAFERDQIDHERMMPDEYGKKWAQELVIRMNELLTQKNEEANVVYKHITAEQMARPKDFHIARVAYIDGTGQFNPDELEDVDTGEKVAPMGFVTDYGNNELFAQTSEERNYPFAEVGVEINIALEHGFNDKFTKHHPFVLVIVGQDNKQLEELKEAVRKKVIDILPPEKQAVVKIDGFVRP